MKILPSTYAPSIDHIRAILSGDYVIDIGEHYVKRSPRNRAEIMTAGGVMQLTVNICQANRPGTPMSRVMIDYSKRWQHQHWMAIVSAYKSSPYFDYFADHLEPIFRHRYERLVDLNIAFTEKILELSQRPTKLNISEQYVEAKEGDIDLRPKGSMLHTNQQQPYMQVFGDRLPFTPNLSALDMLFCEGGVF